MNSSSYDRAMSNPVPLRLAATCIPIREVKHQAGIEILMVRRNPELIFGGMWTFPGGVFEKADGPAPSNPTETGVDWGDPRLLSTAARAAARETLEETAIVCDTASLAWFSHWIPPLVGPAKRFATWFFLAPEHRGILDVNTDENDEACWISPSAALERSRDGGFPLAVPTWVTLDDLQSARSLSLLIDSCITRGARRHHTRALRGEEETVLLWEGDSAYDASQPDVPGRRNRVRAASSGEVIERMQS